jgi:hypothetical protein
MKLSGIEADVFSHGVQPEFYAQRFGNTIEVIVERIAADAKSAKVKRERYCPATACRQLKPANPGKVKLAGEQIDRFEKR